MYNFLLKGYECFLELLVHSGCKGQGDWGGVGGGHERSATRVMGKLSHYTLKTYSK